MERVVVFIDGSNLYHKLRSSEIGISRTLYFDYRGLAKMLSGGRDLKSCRYFIGVVRPKQDDKKGQKLRSKQQQLFHHLQSEGQHFTVKRGYIMNHGGSFHEKGVDVQLASDILIGAYEDLYDVAIVISSDTDLIPAFKQAIKLGKKVEYIGFVGLPSKALINVSSSYKLLKRHDILQLEG